MRTQNTALQLDYNSTAEEHRESILQRVLNCIDKAQQETKKDTSHVLDSFSNRTASNDDRLKLGAYDNDYRGMNNPYLKYSVADLKKTLDSVQNNTYLWSDEKRQHSALIRLAYAELQKIQRR